MASLNEIQERTFLVGLALEHISDTELTKPRADDGGPPAGDHDNIDPRGEQHLDAETVLDIKVLAELSLGTGNDLAVGEDAVHIEDDQLDFFGFVFY
jgi:hypothetical protein